MVPEPFSPHRSRCLLLSGLLAAAMLGGVPLPSASAGPDGTAPGRSVDPVDELEEALLRLERRPTDRRAQRRVAALADPALAALVARAEAAERERRWLDGLAACDRAGRLMTRLQRRSVSYEGADVVTQTRARLARRSVEHSLQAASDLSGQRLWGAVIAQLEGARALAVDDTEIRGRLRDAWRSWAQEAADAGRPGQAAQRALAAAQAAGEEEVGEDRARAAAWLREAGRARLATGRCRAAVEAFAQADALHAIDSGAADADRARQCSQVVLRTAPSGATDPGLLSPNTLAGLDGALRAALAGNASRFARVLGLSQRDPEAWTVALQVEFVDGPRTTPRRTQRTANLGGDSDCFRLPAGVPCLVGARITWDEYVEDHRLRLVATLVITPPGGDGPVQPARRLAVEVSTEVRWGGDAVAYAASTDRSGGSSTSVGYSSRSPSTASRSEIEQLRRQARRQLELEGANLLAMEAARLTLALLDVERGPTPPEE